MPFVTYVLHDGVGVDVELPVGTSVMRGALENLIDGIAGDCGGVAGCGTCHVFIDPAWIPAVGLAHEHHELAMLDLVPDRASNSRLGCQILVDHGLDGLVVHLPEHQL